MPDAAWAVLVHPPSSSRKMGQPPVLTSSNRISTLLQRFACARLSQSKKERWNDYLDLARRRKSMKEWQRRKATGERCWYPVRQKENGDWEFEPVYGVGEPICVYRERTDDPQIS
jgi:hypothetical protein